MGVSPVAGGRGSRGGSDHPAVLDVGAIDAVIFDMDGVVTDTASLHAAAWKQLFDQYLAERSRRTGEPFVAFDVRADYLPYVDGKPRYDGVRSFLASRSIFLPEGETSDPPDRETVCGLGNRKDSYFLAKLRDEGALPYPSTVDLVRALKARGVGTAVISASRNMREVLASAGLSDLFQVQVDGLAAEELRLPGKPDPAVFLEAARRLGTEPSRAAIVEDAMAGVEAGQRGGFAFIVGIARSGQIEALRAAGADVVVADLAELSLSAAPGSEAPHPTQRSIADLPSAVERLADIAELIGDRTPAVFLDYDGTLTPIVDDPARALLPDGTRRVIERLAARCPLAVVSGRDLPDVQAMVSVPGIWYAGSHGFDIAGPNGQRHQRAEEFLPALDGAEQELRSGVEPIPGAWVERKRFAVAVHYRLTPVERIPDVETVVEAVASKRPELRRTGGKKVFELRPSLPWDKGKALLWLMDVLGLDRADASPIYVGDDETDEDAFRAVTDPSLGNPGMGVVVRGEGDDRPTAARYALSNTDEVRVFLEGLLALMERRA